MNCVTNLMCRTLVNRGHINAIYSNQHGRFNFVDNLTLTGTFSTYILLNLSNKKVTQLKK